MKKTIFLALGLALVGLAMMEVKQVAWGTSCQDVGWDAGQPTCKVAQSDRTFSFNLCTTAWSDNNPGTFDFELIVDHTPGTSPHIENGAVIPDSFDVFNTSCFNSTCSGSLETGFSIGTFAVSAWDNVSQPQCSGGHEVTIKQSGSTCP